MPFILIADTPELAAVFAEQYVLPRHGRICEVDYSDYAFSVMLTDFILGARMEYKLRALAEKRLPSLKPEQKELLVRRSMEMLSAESFRWGLFAGKGRYAVMRGAIDECLRGSSCFDLGGFETFRMRGLEDYLAALMSVAVHELLEIEEDKEYYRLLRGFMKGRGCGYEVVRLVLLANGNYLLQGRCLYGLMCLEGGRVAGFTDMIITSLLCLAPQVLEIEQERELMQHDVLLRELDKVFGARIRHVR